MKNTLRRIQLNDRIFLWNLKTSIVEINSESQVHSAQVILKVYLDGMKNTPLTVHFNVMDDPITGTRITSSSNELNLNRPFYVRMMIEAGVSRGWVPEENGYNIENGLEVLEENEIDTSGI